MIICCNICISGHCSWQIPNKKNHCNIKKSTWWWSKHMNKNDDRDNKWIMTHVIYILYKLASFLLFLKSCQPLTKFISMRKLKSFLSEAYNYNRALLCMHLVGEEEMQVGSVAIQPICHELALNARICHRFLLDQLVCRCD